MQEREKKKRKTTSGLILPANVSNFKKMREEGYFFVDNSHVLKCIYNTEHSIFTAPQRFGKTTILSMCSVFFDKNTSKETFQNCFSDLNISKELSKKNNLGAQSFYVLKFNFAIDVSKVSPQAHIEEVFTKRLEHSFNKFCVKYHFDPNQVIDKLNYENTFVNLFGKSKIVDLD